MQPATFKSLILRESSPAQDPIYHDAVLEEAPIPALRPGEILVKITAVAFNRKDLWIRLGKYPGIKIGAVLGGDAAGTVVASSAADDALLHKRVFLVPIRGWDSGDPPADATWRVLGGGSTTPSGVFSDYVVVARDQVILSPAHLDDVHTAAWPIGGLTAWRATMVNAQVQKGHNVLVTGIGGGVALIAMQLCLAQGARVYVSSGSESKIEQAVALGAAGGVSYRSHDWPAQLAALVKTTASDRPFIDAVIDSGGGEIMTQSGKFLKAGGRVVCFGMTANPKITFTMREVLKNQQLIASTMGSRQDLIDATSFLALHRIAPHVSHVLDGLEAAEEGFALLKHGGQFGKIVIRVRHAEEEGGKHKL